MAAVQRKGRETLEDSRPLQPPRAKGRRSMARTAASFHSAGSKPRLAEVPRFYKRSYVRKNVGEERSAVLTATKNSKLED